MIFVPQLAVIEFKLQQPEDGKKQLEALSKKSFFFSYDEQSNNGIFYKMFPKKGGRFLLENTEYIFKPPKLTPERPRVRLILAVPSDFDYLTAGNEFASLVRRIKMVALMAQSVIATALRRRYGNEANGCLTFCFDSKWEPKVAALRRRYGNDANGCLTFCFDSKWEPKAAEVPVECRSFSGNDQLFLSAPNMHAITLSGPFMLAGEEELPVLAVLKTHRASAELYGTRDMATYFIKCLELLAANMHAITLSGPFMLAGEEELPVLAVLKTHRASAELYGTRDMATYFIKCLELLGERNPLFLLNLIFIIPKISGNMASGVPERFETKRDVCVISSPLLVSLPDSVSTWERGRPKLKWRQCKGEERLRRVNVAGEEGSGVKRDLANIHTLRRQA
uniref:Uncharacterized protein n=1 Tax=Ascaris lumbricoides TaxID=6252 RepID=A0A0M3IKA6_ASCLU